jgi:hypothetical protein
MTIYDILKKSVDLGITHDFRGEEAARNFIWKEIIDSGDGRSFENVYPDTGVVALSSALTKPVRRAVVGIDVGTADILALLRWSEKTGKEIDLFIGHHPEGRLNGAFPLMLHSHIGNIAAFGVDVSHLKDKYDELIEDIMLDTLSTNFTQIHDAIHYLGTDYIGLHTPPDNMGARFVQKYLAEKQPRTLQETIDVMLEIGEYAHYHGINVVTPIIVSGKPEDELGKFTLTEFTGGEEGPVEVYMELKNQGVDTIICMHLTDKATDRCRDIGLQVISTGHMPSDSIGLNLLCDILEAEGVEIVPVSGFVRIPRTTQPSHTL